MAGTSGTIAPAWVVFFEISKNEELKTSKNQDDLLTQYLKEQH